MLLLCIFKHLPKCHLYYFQTLRLFGDSLDANELSKKDYLNQHSEWQKAYRLHAQHTASSFPVSCYLPKSRLYTQSKKTFSFVTTEHSYFPSKDLNLLDLRKLWFPWLLSCFSATHSTHTHSLYLKIHFGACCPLCGGAVSLRHTLSGAVAQVD